MTDFGSQHRASTRGPADRYQTGRLSRVWASIVFTIAGLGWFGLELSPQFYGFRDTDSPQVMLAFLAEHSRLFALAGLCLVVLAFALVWMVQQMRPVVHPDDATTRRASFGLSA